MKTEGMAHQKELLRIANGRPYFAYFMEQGTGKTWCAIAEAERFYTGGQIDAMLVIAPNGVHTNWVKREFPAHFDGELIARAWRSGMGKRETAKVEELLKPRDSGGVVPLRVLAMNIEAVNTKAGYDFAQRFLLATKAMLVVDESSRIGNIEALQTKALFRLRRLVKFVRIATGTPISNAPVRIFSQFEFMSFGLLGTSSYRAFVAEFAEVLPAEHPLVKNMIERTRRERGDAAAEKMRRAQIVATNPDGSKRWRNLDKLQRLIAPHSFRVLKRDCLDLPEKIYTTRFFDLTPAQRRAYALMEEQHRVELEDGPLAVSALSARTKLQQITSGFIHLPDGTTTYIDGDNPRIDSLLAALEEVEGQVIVWAKYVEECRAIAKALTKAGVSFVEYRGETKRADREAAIDRFQAREVKVFLGQVDTGATGITLTAAETAIIFSCDYNLETRQQFEDRCHRKGTVNNVVYIDLVANDTVDEAIARALQTKAAVASIVLGDDRAPEDRRKFADAARAEKGN